ncbi:CPBP family intramembrane glutamic endopeptidase [Fructilactobacillus frigidiflavus]|uniref:CPBP family intramembrane glutamic endopeptidase n=1 Tax=Fructilactobacillus frigidiflavus TaxID=3242688 RepID=UPI00375725B0
MKLIRIFGNFILFQLIISVPIYMLSILNKNLFSYYSLATLFIIIQLVYVFLENKHYNLYLFNLKFHNYRKIITLGMALILINQLVFIFLANEKVIDNSSADVFINLSETHGCFPFVYVLILAPILEEIFFRGIFYRILIPANNIVINYKIWIIIFINAILFSYLHSPLGLNSICYFIGSLILSVSYLKSKDLKVPIILHSFNNIISLIIPNLIN